MMTCNKIWCVTYMHDHAWDFDLLDGSRVRWMIHYCWALGCWSLCIFACVLQSGTKDLSSVSLSSSIPREGSPLASHVASCTTQDLQLVKHIWEEIREIRKDVLEVKEAVKKLVMGQQVEVQMRMEQQQQLGAISNVETQLHDTMQPAQWPRVSELGSTESVYQTAPSSRTNSKSSQDMGGPVSMPVRVRCLAQPPTTLNLQTDSKQQPVDQPTSPISRDSRLDYVPEENTDLELSPQVRQCMHIPTAHAKG